MFDQSTFAIIIVPQGAEYKTVCRGLTEKKCNIDFHSRTLRTSSRKGFFGEGVELRSRNLFG